MEPAGLFSEGVGFQAANYIQGPGEGWGLAVARAQLLPAPGILALRAPVPGFQEARMPLWAWLWD